MAYAVLQAQEMRVRPDEMGNALQRGPRMGRLGEDQPQRGPCRELLGPRGTHAGLQQPLIGVAARAIRSEEHTSELQSQSNLVCRLLLEKKKKRNRSDIKIKSLNSSNSQRSYRVFFLK